MFSHDHDCMDHVTPGQIVGEAGSHVLPPKYLTGITTFLARISSLCLRSYTLTKKPADNFNRKNMGLDHQCDSVIQRNPATCSCGA